MKGLKPALRTALLLVLGLVLGVQIYLWNAQNLTGNSTPMPFGVGASVVLSGSMEPTLSVGDLLLVRAQETYEVGDIVVYQSGTMPVVHRIIAVEGDSVLTQGDANNVADTPFHKAQIKGSVTAAVPLVGYLVWGMKTPVGILVTVALAVLLVELSYRTGRRKQDEEKEQIKAEIRRLMEELEQNNQK